MAASDPVLDAWDDDLGPLYIMEEIPAPPLTRPAHLLNGAGDASELSRTLDPETVADLKVLSSFIRPLPPGEAEKRRQAYASTEGGYLTREVIMRALLGEFDG